MKISDDLISMLDNYPSGTTFTLNAHSPKGSLIHLVDPKWKFEKQFFVDLLKNAKELQEIKDVC